LIYGDLLLAFLILKNHLNFNIISNFFAN